MHKGANIFKSIKAFTLMEVLVVLAVIGVIYALTIQPLINNIQTQSYKTAYQKVEADGQAALTNAINDGKIVSMPSYYDAPSVTTNWEAFKSEFIVTKSCESNNNGDCWDQTGEHVWNNTKPTTAEYAFIDNKGRAWSVYYGSEPIILCDINGFKGSNQYGKDRFIFIFSDINNNPWGVPFTKFGPLYIKDFPTVDTNWCPSGGCYYLSWLTGAN